MSKVNDRLSSVEERKTKGNWIGLVLEGHGFSRAKESWDKTRLQPLRCSISIACLIAHAITPYLLAARFASVYMVLKSERCRTFSACVDIGSSKRTTCR